MATNVSPISGIVLHPQEPLTISSLPTELFLHCISFLDPIDLGRCSLVNNSWDAFSNDDSLWKALFQRIFPGITQPSMDAKKSFQAAKECCVKDEQGFLARLDKLCELQPDQIGKITCEFALNPGHRINIVLTYGSREKHMPSIVDRRIILMAELPNLQPPGSLFEDKKHKEGVYFYGIKTTLPKTHSLIIKTPLVFIKQMSAAILADQNIIM